MTTVAVGGMIMAADTRHRHDNGIYDSGKLIRINDWVVGTCGTVKDGDNFCSWVENGLRGHHKRVGKGFEALLLRRTGDIFYVCDNDRMRRLRNKYYAIGSGGAYAFGALTMQERIGWPLDPELAVHIASEWDVGTGGAVDVLTWR